MKKINQKFRWSGSEKDVWKEDGAELVSRIDDEQLGQQEMSLKLLVRKGT